MHDEIDEARLTAYALGEMEDEERVAVEALLQRSAAAWREVEAIRETASALEAALATAPTHTLTPTQRAAVEEAALPAPTSVRRRRGWRIAAGVAGLAAAAGIVAGVVLPSLLRARVAIAPRVADGYRIPLPASAPPTGPLMSEERERLKALGYISGGEVRYLDGETDSALNGLRSPSAPFNTEAYDHIRDNPFVLVAQDPRSTFSVDVDTASYAIVRRYLNGGQLPPKDAVRIEELLNYFLYSYAPPDDDRPFAVHVETAACPWKPDHRLVRIGIKGREVARADRPPGNLVFLIDVSGSMNEPDKLPLVKAALRLLVSELRPVDRVAIVVYAGAEGLALPSTRADDKAAILEAIDSLSPAGSTHGSAGLRLAYETAARGFVEGGVNRVILATDGDFNVGITNEGDLVRLIEHEAKSGVFLTALGFGMGNLKDSTLEKLADHGNGQYAYIDSLAEARKLLVEQIGGTLVAIAKDVKLQVEFNPAEVTAFRLIGYENRVLAHRDFNDDARDAGDIGVGHTVTTLYEIVPRGVSLAAPGVDPLKYQRPPRAAEGAGSGELLTLKLRYKAPDSDRSELMEVPVRDDGQDFAAASPDYRFAAAVAAFGMSLRDSPYKGGADLGTALQWARASVGDDPGGFRVELLTLIEKARPLSRQ